MANKIDKQALKMLKQANQYLAQGYYARAEQLYNSVLRRNPNDAYALCYLGVLLHHTNRSTEALKYLNKACKIEPKNPTFWHNYGSTLQEMGRIHKSIQTLQKARALRSDFADTYHNLRICYTYLGDKDAAYRASELAVRYAPRDTEILLNHANLLRQARDMEGAHAYYKQAVAYNPTAPDALINLYAFNQSLCLWDNYDDEAKRMVELTEQEMTQNKALSLSCHTALNLPSSRAFQFKTSQYTAQFISKNLTPLPTKPRRLDNEKAGRIRLGYLSNDFHNHATMHLMAGIFRQHDRKQFEIYIYSHGPEPTNDESYRKQLLENVDKFRDVRSLEHTSTAELIQEDEIDILIDLKGHTAGTRFQICALRPAPITVTYVGFPASTGANYIDYIIADANVAPLCDAEYFSEKIVHMPHCYLPNDNQQAIATRTPSRDELGLPTNAFVFASLNSQYKITPDNFACWMQCLQEVDNSVLWMYLREDIAKSNIRKEAKKHGIASDRIIFMSAVDKPKHLARIRQADLVLDTFIINGHTTTCDALWAGVPVLTLEGNTFASRVASSHLNAVNMPSLVTKTKEAYVHRAIELARDTNQLQKQRARLAENLKTAPLFQTETYVRHLEKAFATMWAIYKREEEPRAFSVETREVAPEVPDVVS